MVSVKHIRYKGKKRLPPVYRPTEAYSYMIFKEGDTYYAKNGETREIVFEDDDASEVIQSAINTGRGLILIREGTYEISTPIRIEDKKFVYITGMGKWRTILKYAGADPIFSVIGAGERDHTVAYIRFKDLTFQGLGNAFTGIDAKYMSWLFLEDIEFSGIFSTALRLTEVWGVKAKDIFFHSCGGVDTHIVEILASTTDKTTAGTWTGCRWESMYGNAVKIDKSVNQKFIACGFHLNPADENAYRGVDVLNGSVGIAFDSCFFGAGKDNYIKIDGSHEVRIANCHFDSPYSLTMIYITGGSKGITITGNVFGGRFAPYPVKGICIHSDDAENEVEIVGNEAFGDRSSGSRFVVSKGKAEIVGNRVLYFEYGINVTYFAEIIGNYVEGCGYDGIIAKSLGGGVILGNFCLNNGQSGCGAGICLDGGKHYVVVGNICRDNQSTKTQDYGIREVNADYNIICGNRVMESVVSGLSISGAHTIYKHNLGHPTENSGVATISGDGTTTTFTVDIEHGLVTDRVACKITLDRDGSIDKVYLVDTNSDGFYETIRVQVTYASAPASGEEVPIYWSAEVVE